MSRPTPKPLVLFAHGAGVPSSSPWMVAWRKRLSTLGRAVTFDYPYMRDGRKMPDRLPKLIAAHRQALEEARRDGERVVLAGKSMGSRVGCHLSLEQGVHVDALVCFGYPLVGGTLSSGAAKMRDEVLVALTTPILFIQGTRDELCPLDELERVRDKMKATSVVHVVETGDHSLMVAKNAPVTQTESDTRVLESVRRFLAGA